MKSRVAEQVQSSFATFLISVVALKALEPKYVSQFYLATCGCQVASALLSARVVTPVVASNARVRFTAKCLWSLARQSVLYGVPVAAVAFVSTNGLSVTTAVSHSGEGGLLLGYCAIQLAFEITRRLAAANAGGAGFMVAAQSVRLIAPVSLIGMWQMGTVGPRVFFGLLCLCLAIACGCLVIRLLALNRGGPRFIDAVGCGGSAALTWGTSVAEALTVVAWANVPIFLMANLSGSLAVAHLVAVRTPVSAFNIGLEFIDVHTRHISFGDLWRRRKRFLVIGAVGLWSAGSVVLWAYGATILRVIARPLYEGARVELVLFWLLQLAILVDKVTLNDQRRVAPTSLSLASALSVVAACTTLSIVLVSRSATAGGIAAMIVWCFINIVVRQLRMSAAQVPDASRDSSTAKMIT
jgi:hypothetical protein